MNSKRNRKGRRGNRGKRAQQVVLSRRDPSFPPQNNVKPLCSRVLRFVGAGTGMVDYPVTRRCLLNLVLSVVTGSTNAVCVYEAVRLNRVSMYWCPDPTEGFGSAANELVLTWTGDRAPDTRISDRGTLTHPAVIKSRPPRNSLADKWSNVGADLDEALFYFRMGTEIGIIDVDLTLCIGDGTTKTCVVVAPAFTGIGIAALDNAIVAGTVGTELFQADSLTYVNMTTP